MFTLRSSPIWLLALCLVVLAAANTATAKKPTQDPPPEPPALYEVHWLLQGEFSYEYTYANDINVDGTIVGTLKDPDCTSRAVYWEAGFGEDGLGSVSGARDLTSDVSDDRVNEGGGYLSCAERINNLGLIAGCYKDADGGHVYVCDPNADEGDDDLWVLYQPGSFSIRDMNNAGTVVGYFLNEAQIKQGFVWHSQTGDFLELPPYFLPSGINDDGWVVGIFGDPKSNLSGEVFEWRVDSDPETDARLLGATAVLFAPANGRPAINNDRTIAATASAGRLSGATRLPAGSLEWQLLTKERGQVRVCDINNLGQICGKCNPQKPQLFPGGFVYDELGEKFWLLDERIVFDNSEDGLWWVIDSISAIPRAVADADESGVTTYNGFSMVVGWKGGDSFLLIPVQNPDYPAP